MPLTKTERRLLTAYRRFHEEGQLGLAPYFGRTYARSLLFIVLVLAILLYVSLYVIDSPGLAAFVLGIVFGRLLGQLRSFWHTRAVWPVIDSVTDWHRVNEALGQQADSPA
jgi:hypothetical protein